MDRMVRLITICEKRRDHSLFLRPIFSNISITSQKSGCSLIRPFLYWAGFGPVGITEKKNFGAHYEHLLMTVFSCFHGEKIL